MTIYDICISLNVTSDMGRVVKFNSRRGDIWTRAGKTAEVVLACVYPVGGRDASCVMARSLVGLDDR